MLIFNQKKKSPKLPYVFRRSLRRSYRAQDTKKDKRTYFVDQTCVLIGRFAQLPRPAYRNPRHVAAGTTSYRVLSRYLRVLKACLQHTQSAASLANHLGELTVARIIIIIIIITTTTTRNVMLSRRVVKSSAC